MRQILPILAALLLLACASISIAAVVRDGENFYSSARHAAAFADRLVAGVSMVARLVEPEESAAVHENSTRPATADAALSGGTQRFETEKGATFAESVPGNAGGVWWLFERRHDSASPQQSSFRVFKEDWFLRSHISAYDQRRQRLGPVHWLGSISAIPNLDWEMLHGAVWLESVAPMLTVDGRDGVLGSYLFEGERAGAGHLPEGVFTGVEVAVAGLAASVLLLIIYCLNRKKVRARMQSVLSCDALTGLNTLEKFKDECAAHLEQHGGQSYAIIQIDINKFKIINDKFGFAVGDKLLQVCGDALRNSLSDSEICARCFADQFVAFVRYEGLDTLGQRVRHIIDSVEQWRLESNFPSRIDLHCGVYIFNEEHRAAHDIQQALDLAGYALQEAKQHGKSRVVFYDESMRKVSLLHQDLKDGIGFALEKGELQVWFQPKVDMLTNGIIGSEALVRWYHPTHGLLLPGSFIPLFERSGDVLRVDFHIFEQVCSALQSWENAGISASTVSCNFSSQHFERPEFSRKLVEIASRYSIPHGLLEVEITESTMLRNPEAANIQIKQLKELGFRTTIDDFGSGYSSLGLLQLFAADVIKFDRSFVKRNIAGRRAQIVLGSMIELTKQLGMSAICEGVETEEQAKILMRHGCYNAQGFYYAKPMPACEFEKMLRVGRVFPVNSISADGDVSAAVGGLGTQGA
ncbi:putative bifunctional diguanylate cyclase/phosphodiesterase [Desulfovibrio intestinalis]|uniref:Diguanylate cyclase (GGDEF)-like protein n=1 Tax=Desulfovibrio intestinalis TaxID=58621 RepID=A0A7W8C274_9BACT|nr:GGDEF domain-containing phosphodiesterase [Desulfovibrio intestinalis]MBB5143019.1 diguanylate cyclase (GGDEF)-like protein [Desulfovibrio intestinalis]